MAQASDPGVRKELQQQSPPAVGEVCPAPGPAPHTAAPSTRLTAVGPGEKNAKVKNCWLLVCSISGGVKEV